MKTIEERATEIALSLVRLSPMNKPTTRELLIKMATDQHKIDIENAYEAYCNVVCQAEQKSGKRCYWRVQNERCPELESFVKVMEGEE